jgi:hypothetical protein
VVEVRVGAAVIEVIALREFMPMEAVWMLHKARTAPLGKDAAVIAVLHHDGAVAVQPAMDVDAAVRIMEVAWPAVGADANYGSI